MIISLLLLLSVIVHGRFVRAERHGRRRSAPRGAGELDTYREPAAAGDCPREPDTQGHGRRTSDCARDDHEQVSVAGVAPRHPDESRPANDRSHRQGKSIMPPPTDCGTLSS